MSYKIITYVLCLFVLSSCSSENQRNVNIATKSSNVINVDTSVKLDCDKILSNKIKVRNSLLRYCKQQKKSCSSSDARSSALQRLWRIYGKDDIRMPYQVKSKGNMWDVYGYRNKEKEYGKTVHVIIPKNNKNCAIKQIKHEYLKVCTLIGCDNSVTVKLSSPLKPGKYSIYTKFDNEKKTDKVIITVSKKTPINCKRQKNIPSYYSSLLDFSDCKGSKEIIKIGQFSHFIVSNEPKPIEQTLDPVKMSVIIKNSKGISILKRDLVLRYKKQNSHQPNGKDCEPICYKATIKL